MKKINVTLVIALVSFFTFLFISSIPAFSCAPPPGKKTCSSNSNATGIGIGIAGANSQSDSAAKAKAINTTNVKTDIKTDVRNTNLNANRNTNIQGQITDVDAYGGAGGQGGIGYGGAGGQGGAGGTGIGYGGEANNDFTSVITYEDKREYLPAPQLMNLVPIEKEVEHKSLTHIAVEKLFPSGIATWNVVHAMAEDIRSRGIDDDIKVKYAGLKRTPSKSIRIYLDKTKVIGMHTIGGVSAGAAHRNIDSYDILPLMLEKAMQVGVKVVYITLDDYTTVNDSRAFNVGFGVSSSNASNSTGVSATLGISYGRWTAREFSDLSIAGTCY